MSYAFSRPNRLAGRPELPLLAPGTPMTQNYLTLTRQSLYDMVWTRPLTQVAQDFGICDVALAKRCRAVDVPVPPRGYWA